MADATAAPAKGEFIITISFTLHSSHSLQQASGKPTTTQLLLRKRSR